MEENKRKIALKKGFRGSQLQRIRFEHEGTLCDFTKNTRLNLETFGLSQKVFSLRHPLAIFQGFKGGHLRKAQNLEFYVATIGEALREFSNFFYCIFYPGPSNRDTIGESLKKLINSVLDTRFDDEMFKGRSILGLYKFWNGYESETEKKVKKFRVDQVNKIASLIEDLDSKNALKIGEKEELFNMFKEKGYDIEKPILKSDTTGRAGGLMSVTA